MRTTILAGIVGVAVLIFSAPTTPAHAGCETVGCSTECWRVGSGHRRCQRRCTRRCWNDEPRYYAPPQQTYSAPSYQPYQQFNGFNIDPGLVAAFGIAAIVVVVVAIAAAASGNDLNNEIAKIDASTAEYHAQADDYAQRTAAIYDNIEQQEHAAFLEGRADADREWNRTHRS